MGMDQYQPRQLSTYALTMFRKEYGFEPDANGDLTISTTNAEYTDDAGTRKTVPKLEIDFWDTAGQERFASMHPSYYYCAHACILVFDVTRKQTYQHLTDWYKEMREQAPDIPVIVIANKIDVDPRVTNKNFKFAEKKGLGFHFASAADGTNVVKVRQDFRIGSLHALVGNSHLVYLL